MTPDAAAPADPMAGDPVQEQPTMRPQPTPQGEPTNHLVPTNQVRPMTSVAPTNQVGPTAQVGSAAQLGPTAGFRPTAAFRPTAEFGPTVEFGPTTAVGPERSPAAAVGPAASTAASPVVSLGPAASAHRATVVVDHVSRWYGNVVAVNDVSVAVGPGVTGLLGPNGAGKSTVLHLVAGLLRPSAGSVSVLGAPSWRNPAVYAKVGLVPERENVYAFLTGREFVRLNARLQQLPDPDGATRSAIAIVDLEDAADRPVGTYSKGMRQRIKVAAGLVHDPEVLLLDEPFNGMDPRQRLHMMELLTSLAAQGRTILFSSHILEEVERLAQSVLVIVAGRLAASGDFREIRRLMTDRPHTFTIHSSENRRLAAALLGRDPVFGVELADGLLTVRAADYAAFTRLVAGVARDNGVSLYEVRPTDESLESVFQYLVTR